MSKTSRRELLQWSAMLGFGVWVQNSEAWFESKSPNEKVNLAVIGTANRAKSNMREMGALNKENLHEASFSENMVALADVDSKFLGQAGEQFPKAKLYGDWRKMLEQKDIDAVLVATPDHTHAHAVIAALQLGKHVYSEKPLTHNVYEARRVLEEAKKAKTATQMGTQIHAGDNYRRVVELLQAGAIGTVRRIHVWVDGFRSAAGRPTDTPPVPENLNWDLWLSGAAYRPYHPSYHPFNWRGYWEFGGGQLADMGCHHIDLSHWAFGLRNAETVEAEGPEADRDVPPKWLRVHYRYAAAGHRPAIHLTWYHGGQRPAEVLDKKAPDWKSGSLFVGGKGMLISDYSKHLLLPESEFKDYKRPEVSIPKSIGHHAEWFKAIKEGTPTTCNFEYASALTQTVLLGNAAFRSGRKIEWDGIGGVVKNGGGVEKYLRSEYRKGWEI